MTERDKRIWDGLNAHMEESKQYFQSKNIVALCLQGSQNYGLDYEHSDIDTKLITLPSFHEIAFNLKPVSTTHVRENDEHIDFKDLRLYMATFRKQNLNFLEILFTPYFLLNESYTEEWNKLIENREAIAHFNPYRAVKSMKGVVLEKFHALQHPYPSKVDILAQWNYDPKQLHHLLRVGEFLDRYIAGEPYLDCMCPKDREYLVSVKRGLYQIDDAVELANKTMAHITEIADQFCATHPDECDAATDKMLNDVQYAIMTKCVREELITHF